jgi:hypothetical protein
MVDRANGRKKSNFVAKPSVDAGSYMDYFVNGTNYKISYDNFVSGLGVTGSIVSEGPAVSTPILDIDGSVNKIRVIENGSGIKAEISPSNGAEISHNFVADVVGTPMFLNTLGAQPVIASLVAGAGMTITPTDNYVTLSTQEAAEYGTVTMQANATATVITSTATAVKAAGTFVVGATEGYTGDTTGRLTHTGDTGLHVVNAIITVNTASGANHLVSIYVAKNGLILPNTRMSDSVSANVPRSIASFVNVELAVNDYVEIFVRNESTTDDLTVINATLGAL